MCKGRSPFLAAQRLGQAKKNGEEGGGEGRGGEGRGGEEKEMLAGKPHDSEESACPRAGV